MIRRVIISGLLGGLVFIVCSFLINGLFGFKSRLDMKQLPNERQVYEILKENVREGGRYGVNPEMADDRFPGNQPAFSILYGGVGHEAAGRQMLIQLPLFFLIPLAGAWLLARCSIQILANYWKKVLFFTGIGLIIALYSNLSDFGIADYPFSDALQWALHSIVIWTLMGLAVAWKLKPAAE